MQVYNGWIRYTDLRERTESTIGELAQEQDKDRIYNTHCAQDQADEMLKDYVDQIVTCLENGKKHFHGDFYIQVLFCLDRIIPDRPKNIFIARESCPEPFYDEAAYKYHKQGDHLEYLWMIPDYDTAELYRYHIDIVPDEEKDLLENVRKYYNGDFAKREYLENNPDKKTIMIAKE